MIVKGSKRWIILVIVSFLSCFLVYLPYLRFNYYDQLVMLFTQTKNIVDMAHVNEFIGNYSAVYAVITLIGYPFGGYIADKFREKTLILLGSICVAAATFWFAFLPNQTSIMIIHVMYGFGVAIMFSSYLNVVRKLAKQSEQGRFFSISEACRAVWQTIIGFLGVAVLNSAILSGNSMDPALLGEKWRLMMFVNGGAVVLFMVILAVLLPGDLAGAEVEEVGEVQKEQSFTFRNALEVLKMPGLWLISIFLFCCYAMFQSGSGYLGTYCVNVVGMSETAASTLSIVRNYVLLIVSTFLVGFLADKIKSVIKTLCIYMAACGVMLVCLVLSGNMGMGMSILVSTVYAFFFLGMKGIYFATASEVGIPVRLNGMATGIMSLIMYSPDLIFPKIFGKWLDGHGNAAFHDIWITTAVIAAIGLVAGIITFWYARKEKKKAAAEEESR